MSIKAILDLSIPLGQAAIYTGTPKTDRYPFWRSKVKTKGRRDRSIQQRSNRRKAKVSMRR